MKEKIIIKETEDRLTIAKLLIKNGYTVKLTKVVIAGQKAPVNAVEFWKE